MKDELTVKWCDGKTLGIKPVYTVKCPEPETEFVSCDLNGDDGDDHDGDLDCDDGDDHDGDLDCDDGDDHVVETEEEQDESLWLRYRRRKKLLAEETILLKTTLEKLQDNLTFDVFDRNDWMIFLERCVREYR